MTTTRLQVELGERSYPIIIGSDLFKEDVFADFIQGQQVLLVSNETVAPLYLDRVKQQLKNYQLEILILADGESYKTLETSNKIFDVLLEKKCSRQTTLIALGGGVIGDIVGFAAACYQRGIDFIQVPTTLLAQVDSSVGGKTGVNHALGKNMIGAFHQPNCVISDISTLNTLDERQVRAGVAEIIKYGLIYDHDFFIWLQKNMVALLSLDDAVVSHAINRSCQIKAEIVAQDERECGIRALLNFGHTFGHAIETGMGYGQWLHGEAVAVGMCMAVAMSERMGLITQSEHDQAVELIDAAKLPVQAPDLSTQQFIDLMAVDKKVMDGKIRLVLLNAIGQAQVYTLDDTQDLSATLDHFLQVER